MKNEKTGCAMRAFHILHFFYSSYVDCNLINKVVYDYIQQNHCR